MNTGISIHDRSRSLLDTLRLPARLNVEQVGQVLGFQPHDIPALVKSGLLKPLGGGPRNCVKFFAAFEIETLRLDRRWLDRATKAVSRRRAEESRAKWGGDAPVPSELDGESAGEFRVARSGGRSRNAQMHANEKEVADQ